MRLQRTYFNYLTFKYQTMQTATQTLVKDKKNKSTQDSIISIVMQSTEFEFQIRMLKENIKHYQNLLKNGSRTAEIKTARLARVSYWESEVERLTYFV